MRPLSATQIDTARGCWRKWAFRYRSDLPKPPEKPSAETGKALHAIQEAYLRDGIEPPPTPIGLLARRGLPFLPPPGSGLVEGNTPHTIDGIPFVILRDWYGKTDHVPGLPPGGYVTIDHKTSKDPARYGLFARADALDNVQVLVYGDACEGEERYFRWLYYPTGTGRARVKPADHVITRREVRDGIERIVLPIAAEILRHPAVAPLDMPPNTGHCDAFGGCEYRVHCPTTAADHVTHIFGGNVQTLGQPTTPTGKSLFEDLAARGASPAVMSAAAPTPTAAPVAPSTTPHVPQVPAPSAPGGSISDIFARMNRSAPAPAAAPASTRVDATPEATPAPTPTPASAREHLAVAPLAPAPVALFSDPLTRIGNALIAAGRALGGA